MKIAETRLPTVREGQTRQIASTAPLGSRLGPTFSCAAVPASGMGNSPENALKGGGDSPLPGGWAENSPATGVQEMTIIVARRS